MNEYEPQEDCPFLNTSELLHIPYELQDCDIEEVEEDA